MEPIPTESPQTSSALDAAAREAFPFRERRVAQIVRDFMDAYMLSAQIGLRLQDGELDFETVERLVGESEQSALFRLKEESHALFRFDKTASQEELLAEELFDLAVGALFHEAMKFREGYYLTTTYRPHLERMMQAGSASGHLAETFLRLFEAGQQRMMESALESVELFAETREQLLIMLYQSPESTAVARVLLADPERTEQVFAVPMDALFAQIFGSSQRGHHLAVQGLMRSGHFDVALRALEHCERGDPLRAEVEPLVRGLERLYADDGARSLDELERWLEQSSLESGTWVRSCRHGLELLAQSDVPDWAQRAARLLERLTERLGAAATRDA